MRNQKPTSESQHGATAIAGGAALSLLEALILTLQDKNMIEDHEIDAMFEAAINAHKHHEQESRQSAIHGRIAVVLQRMQIHGNSVRLE